MAYNELYHWGIKGQKWGQRRYRNADGTLTPEGKKRYGSNTTIKNGPPRPLGKSVIVKKPKFAKAKSAFAKLKQNKADYDSLPDNVKAKNYALGSKIGNTAAGMARTGSSLANRINSRKQAAARAKAKSEIDVSKMSNKELQDAITRMNLERQYKDLMTSDISVGKSTAAEILADVGDVVAVAAGVAGIASAVYTITKH